MADKIVRMCFVTEFAVPAVRPIRYRSVPTQKVKGRRCNAGLNATGWHAPEAVESVGMKNANWVLGLSDIALFTYSGVANSFHHLQVSSVIEVGQRLTEGIEI